MDFETEIGLPNDIARENYETMRNVTPIRFDHTLNPSFPRKRESIEADQRKYGPITPSWYYKNGGVGIKLATTFQPSPRLITVKRRRRSPNARGSSQCREMSPDVPQFKPRLPAPDLPGAARDGDAHPMQEALANVAKCPQMSVNLSLNCRLRTFPAPNHGETTEPLAQCMRP